MKPKFIPAKLAELSVSDREDRALPPGTAAVTFLVSLEHARELADVLFQPIELGVRTSGAAKPDAAPAEPECTADAARLVDEHDDLAPAWHHIRAAAVALSSGTSLGKTRALNLLTAAIGNLSELASDLADQALIERLERDAGR